MYRQFSSPATAATIAEYSSTRRLSSLWNGSSEAKFSPIGQSEQRPIFAVVSLLSRRAIWVRFSRNQSGDGLHGRCFEKVKKRSAFLETRPSTSWPPTRNARLAGTTRKHAGQSL